MMSDLIIGLASGIANIVIGLLTKESAAFQLNIDHSKISKTPIGLKVGETEKEFKKLEAGLIKARNAGIVSLLAGCLISVYFFARLVLGAFCR